MVLKFFINLTVYINILKISHASFFVIKRASQKYAILFVTVKNSSYATTSAKPNINIFLETLKTRKK